MKIRTLGSTTISREDLDRAAEPDCADYIDHQPQVAGRRIDFATDPPPDLVVEVISTSTDLDKNRLYAALGVPELWRYWRIFRWQDGDYQECDRRFRLG